MKKLLISSSLFFLFCVITTANNWDLLNPGKHWNVLQVTYNPDMVNHDSTTYSIKFEGDTTINTVKYNCVMYATNAELDNWSLNGFVREDTLLGFYYRNLQGEEGLLYQYNLSLGDSVKILNVDTIIEDSIRYLVAGVDSILVDGIYRKSYTLSQKHYENIPEIWIEGIGSSFGILSCGIIVSGGATRLLCCYDNDVLIYKNPDYPDCYYSTRTSLNSVFNSGSEINVHFGTKNNVLLKSPIENRLRVFNCNGMLVEEIHVLANQEYNLDITNYSKGVFLISPTSNLSGTNKFFVY